MSRIAQGGIVPDQRPISTGNVWVLLFQAFSQAITLFDSGAIHENWEISSRDPCRIRRADELLRFFK
ncbi:MAG: hypothetical protein DIZ78_13020 [endosymbiont of Escarpia spicata]|uniref:Uncharacterized protein n=1 Tax=endosymbiont of Escarpia spicata TaxID=2200908 RepID=A0A370DGW2_9GAMM|nr:MAG: hypothetical protein DIZ78_13020 [endosymbiont of Escarpia spicata]